MVEGLLHLSLVLRKDNHPVSKRMLVQHFFDPLHLSLTDSAFKLLRLLSQLFPFILVLFL